jgi:hypothetical protein
MVLACIFNVFDGEEHLKKAIDYVKDDVDYIIILVQHESNFGEIYCPSLNEVFDMIMKSDNIMFKYFTPDLTKDGFWNEQTKRQMGVDYAKDMGCTHFLLMDCDEFYPDFKELKAEYIESGADGSVCEIETYVAKENYRLYPPMPFKVPFIHKLTKDTMLGGAYQYNCDKTRVTKCVSVHTMSKPMHHMSWVRDNLDRKIRNSSARDFRQNDKIKEDVKYLMENGPKGFKSKYFHGRIILEV